MGTQDTGTKISHFGRRWLLRLEENPFMFKLSTFLNRFFARRWSRKLKPGEVEGVGSYAITLETTYLPAIAIGAISAWESWVCKRIVDVKTGKSFAWFEICICKVTTDGTYQEEGPYYRLVRDESEVVRDLLHTALVRQVPGGGIQNPTALKGSHIAESNMDNARRAYMSRRRA